MCVEACDYWMAKIKIMTMIDSNYGKIESLKVLNNENEKYFIGYLSEIQIEIINQRDIWNKITIGMEVHL